MCCEARVEDQWANEISSPSSSYCDLGTTKGTQVQLKTDRSKEEDDLKCGFLPRLAAFEITFSPTCLSSFSFQFKELKPAC